MKIDVDTTVLLSDKRFQLSRLEVAEKLKELKNEGLIDENQIEKILSEDILLKMKYRTYKKCIRQIFIAMLLIGVGFGLMHNSPLFYSVIVGGIILFISSFFGILSNKLTKNQKLYLN